MVTPTPTGTASAALRAMCAEPPFARAVTKGALAAIARMIAAGYLPANPSKTIMNVVLETNPGQIDALIKKSKNHKALNQAIRDTGLTTLERVTRVKYINSDIPIVPEARDVIASITAAIKDHRINAPTVLAALIEAAEAPALSTATAAITFAEAVRRLAEDFVHTRLGTDTLGSSSESEGTESESEDDDDIPLCRSRTDAARARRSPDAEAADAVGAVEADAAGQPQPKQPALEAEPVPTL